MPNKNKSRLWVLTTEYKPYITGGLGTAATTLTRALVRRGIRATVISRSKTSNISIDKSKRLRIIRFPTNNRYFSVNTHNFKPNSLKSALKSRAVSNPQCIHIHSVQFTDTAELYKKRKKTPIVYTCHSMVSPGKDFRSKRLYEKQKKLFRLADSIVVPSRAEQIKLNNRYPFCARKITVIRHGVNVSPLKAHGHSNHLLFVGRVVKDKGIEELIRATAMLARSNDKIRLNIIGTGSSRYLIKLKSLAKRLGISSKVRWLGKQSHEQVQRMYSKYGAVIMPSRKESFGLVALEALAKGVPLVATRSGGLSDFVNGKVAQVILKVDSIQIARAILQMKKNRTLTERRVRSGRKLAQGMSWSRTSARYLKLFRRISSVRSKRP